jgi:hypothetical protein
MKTMQSGQYDDDDAKETSLPPRRRELRAGWLAGWLAVNQPSYRAEGSSCPRGELAGACRDRDPFLRMRHPDCRSNAYYRHTLRPASTTFDVPTLPLAVTGHGEVQGALSVPYIFATRKQMPSPSDHALEPFHDAPLTAAVPYMSLSRPSLSFLPSPSC